jgi:hypothetical protein
VSFVEPAIGCQLSPFMLVSINVPLEPPDQQYWQAAVGYVELGMFQDANDQLEKIDPFNRAAPEVLAVRLAIYRELKKWELDVPQTGAFVIAAHAKRNTRDGYRTVLLAATGNTRRSSTAHSKLIE